MNPTNWEDLLLILLHGVGEDQRLLCFISWSYKRLRILFGFKWEGPLTRRGTTQGLNLSRCVSICGTRAFFYLLTDRFIALQGVLHKSICLQWVFFFLERPLLGLALVTAPQIYVVGRPGSSATKGGLWEGLYGQPWSEWGLVGCSERFLVLSKCVLRVLHDSCSPPCEIRSRLC